MKKRQLPISTVSNNKAAGSSVAAELELLRQAVRMAVEQLGQALDGDEPSPHAAHIREAKTAAERARAHWQEAWDANKRMPGIIHPCELERLHLRAEIAQLHLAETRVASVQSALNDVQSQLKGLGEEARRLRDRVAMLSVRARLRT